ncbi:MAG: glycosyltransferase 87 family protein [Acidimicrobiales bacterium]
MSARFANWLRPCIAAAVAGIAVCSYFFVVARSYGLDLRVYRDSAAAFRSGHNPYLSNFTQSHLPFTYPPFALVVLSSLTWTSFVITHWLLFLASIAAATAAVAFVLVDRGFANRASLWCGSFAWACISMVLLEPARSGIDYGQIESVLMFMVVADLLVVPAPFRGVLLGIAAAIKLTPLIFVVVLIVRRDWRSVARSGLAIVLLTGLTWLLWPDLSRTFWRHDVFHPARVGPVNSAANQSWFAVVHRPPFPSHGSMPAWLALSMVTVLVGTFVAWRCADTDRQSFAVIAVALVGLLISPISWTHHWVWVLLVPPMLIGPRRHDTELVVRRMLWGIVVLTIAAPYWWISTGALADALEAALPVWTLAALLVWCRVEYLDWRRAPRHSSGAHHREFQSSGASQPAGPTSGRGTRMATTSIHVGWSRPDRRQYRTGTDFQSRLFTPPSE